MIISCLFFAGMTFQDWEQGNAFYTFELTTSLEGSSLSYVTPLLRSGFPRLVIKFSKNTTENITVVALMEYISQLSIDENRVVSLNYVA